jgi:hypothetical protein
MPQGRPFRSLSTTERAESRSRPSKRRPVPNGVGTSPCVEIHLHPGLAVLRFEDSALRPFFDAVPELYWRTQAPVHEAYQRLLYTIEHPLEEATTDAIEAAFGLPHPTWNTGARKHAIWLLDGLRYPDTMPIAQLRAIAGLDLRILSHYLHFFHHAYPIYDQDSCKGLARLGVDIPYVRVRDADTYALYIQAIEALKERVPFWDVPETNVYLTRIIQAALAAYGRATG